MEKTSGVTRKELRVVLRAWGKFPPGERAILWRFALSLPLNHKAYAALASHPSQPLPVGYSRLTPPQLRNLTRLVSNLVYWFPFFEHMKYFPAVLLQFIAVYKNCPTSSFELVASILANYCQGWFEDYPLAPAELLTQLEAVLARRDPALAGHLRQVGLSASAIAWLLLSTFFTEVLEEDSWYTLWDHILVHEYDFFLMVPVAFIILIRKTILAFKNRKDMSRMNRRFNINVEHLIELTKTINSSETCDLIIKKYSPLKGFDNYEKPELIHPEVIFVFNDLDRNGVERFEEELLFNEMETKRMKQLIDTKINNGDIKARKKRMLLLHNHFSSKNNIH